MIQTIRKRLEQEADKDYKDFSAKLIPTIDNVLGVRLPILRKIAKEIYSSNNWEEFLNAKEIETSMEEIMLKGFVIGLIKAEPNEILSYIKNFVPKINNWSVCDSFCVGLKFTNHNKSLVWEFIQPYLKSQKEFEIRFGVVMILNFFVEKDYLNKIFKLLEQIKSDDYYAKMAIAWAISICFIKFPEETFEYLKNSKLDDWTFNKSIQKCIESYRLTTKIKNELRNLKRK